MPCYRCDARQTDPGHGASPWRRGVVAEHLVLVCPACQQQAGWADALASCGRCGSQHLIRRLDQVECLDCRLTRDAAPDTLPPDIPPPREARSRTLADEVAVALERVLRRE